MNKLYFTFYKKYKKIHYSKKIESEELNLVASFLFVASQFRLSKLPYFFSGHCWFAFKNFLGLNDFNNELGLMLLIGMITESLSKLQIEF